VTQPFRIPAVGSVDRATPIRFRFNGRTYFGYAGDTLASALIANGVRLVGRSFKYHRPRGIVGLGAEEPNALVQVGTGAKTVPNLRATQVELVEGLEACSVNVWPSVQFDVGAINGWFAKLLPAGFYYKTFMWPTGLWHTYERVIRRAAGFGTVPVEPDPDHYDHMNAHADVLVVGAGPAGLAAALAAGRRGARVILADEQHQFGASTLHCRERIGESSGAEWSRDAVAELESLKNVRLLPRTCVFGAYRENFFALHERRTDHLLDADARVSRERMWRVRAKQVVLATGALERPLVFANNDRPGVMLAGAISSYVNRYGALPGRRAVVFGNNDAIYTTALDLHEAGSAVRAVVDIRGSSMGTHAQAVRAAGIEVLSNHVITDVGGRHEVKNVSVMALDEAGDVRGEPRVIECDVVGLSGGFSPVIHLHAHPGGKTRFDAELGAFVAAESALAEWIAGAAAGYGSLAQCLESGFSSGDSAAKAAGIKGRKVGDRPKAEEIEVSDMRTTWLVPAPTPAEVGPKRFVDYQNDTTAADLQLAVREGYQSIEHVKRYTALGFGTDQGKLGNINGMGIVSSALGHGPEMVGTTTFRAPYTPVTFGAVAGRHMGDMLDPVRKTAMHHWHEEQGALFENVGQWHRPWYYPLAGESMDEAVNRECLAVRRSVGMMDASTLGKIDVRGPDAAEFLDRIYTNGWKKLGVGRARYGFMLGEDGMVMDDGVSARLADDQYYMTTTTGGAANVLGWMERWRQTEWPELKVYFTSVTDQWATIAVAGPNAKAVLAAAGTDIDLDGDSFPFMSFKQGHVAGVPARVFRISFSGERAYEINVPANFGRVVWDAVFAAGKPFDITPYGTETMHVLRAEKGFVIVGQDTDGSVTPHDLGMSWIVAKHKDFLGRRSLSRSDCVRPGRKQLVGLLTEDPTVVLPEGAQLVNEAFTSLPVPMVGHVTSSYWSASLGHSIALALVKGGHEREGETIYAPLVDGRLVPAKIGPTVFYDVEGVRQNG
jgi:sarcosine oxidase, subunit alpha